MFFFRPPYFRLRNDPGLWSVCGSAAVTPPAVQCSEVVENLVWWGVCTYECYLKHDHVINVPSCWSKGRSLSVYFYNEHRSSGFWKLRVRRAVKAYTALSAKEGARRYR